MHSAGRKRPGGVSLTCESTVSACVHLSVGWGRIFPERLAQYPAAGPTFSFPCTLRPAQAVAGRQRERGRAQPRFRPQTRPARLLLAAGGAALADARGRSSGKPSARLAGEPRRRVEPEPLAAANRAAAGEEPQRGKKESAAESKRLIGGRLSGSGSPGLWPDARKEAALGDSASILAALAAPTVSARKGESRVSMRARRNHPATSSPGRRILTNDSFNLLPPPQPPKGKLRHRGKAAAGRDHAAS